MPLATVIAAPLAELVMPVAPETFDTRKGAVPPVTSEAASIVLGEVTAAIELQFSSATLPNVFTLPATSMLSVS